MTDKQPEALRLADALDKLARDTGFTSGNIVNTAAELRRLHAVEQQRDELAARIAKDDRVLRSSVPERWKGCASHVGAAQSYIAELESDRDELLAALIGMVDYYGTASANLDELHKARAAIAKATGATQ